MRVRPSGNRYWFVRLRRRGRHCRVSLADRNYAANGLNQYTAAGSASLSYDANGNLTSDGSTSFTYDIENRLVAASGAKVAGLRYDPLGRLYETGGASANTRLLYDGDALVGEYSTGGALLRRYVHGLGADEVLAWYEGAGVDGSTRRHLYSNMQGSIVTVMDFSGAVLGINRYDEYGTPQSTNLGRFQFTGQAWIAELGAYYYKARMYSPTLGRFMQTDPIGYADGLGWYGYVGSDPVNRGDPSGLVAWNPQWASSGMCSSGGSFMHCGDVGGDGDDSVITVTGRRHKESDNDCKSSSGCYSGISDALRDELDRLNASRSDLQNEPDSPLDEIVVTGLAAHNKDARPSTRPKHERGEARQNRDRGGEKGDAQRRVPRIRPRDWKGPWPPSLPPLLMPNWMLDPCNTIMAGRPECNDGEIIAIN